MRCALSEIFNYTRHPCDWPDPAPGSPENIPDNREYFNINISPQLNIITRSRHTSVSIQFAVQTRAAGVGKCPNNNPSMLRNAMEINR